ncbi:MAG TPA: M14 family zinc carboxypeptidase, partial [Acidobacteriota bacterium]|nr:M14 family zinc carboxypeptidase [Acidobacteriota bacterium]
MRRISDRLVFAASLALGLAAVVTAAPASTDILLPTQPEATGFRKSNHFEDVTAYIRELQSRSDKLRVEILLQTAEGRKVPLVVLGDPLPESPAAALADARPVVFLQGNIHAGEVEGKDSLLMLMRDMLLGDKRELLRRNIYLVVPIFNADSN